MRTRAVLALCLSAVVSVRAACSQTSARLALDAAKPIVYIEFDHAGPRRPVQDGEPSKGLWLRLVNNSLVTIVVQANGNSNDADMTILPDTITAVLGKIPKSGPVKEKMPFGYASDTGSPLTIEPGKSLMFSVPANHVSRAWSMQVPFHFSLPAVRQGVQPLCLVEFTWGDLPTADADFGHQISGHAMNAAKR